MLKLLRFTFSTCFIIALLSINLKGRPLFHYAYQYSKMIVIPAQESTQELLRISYHRSVNFCRQFFNNNVPAVDSLDYQLAAPHRDESEYLKDQKKIDDIFGN